MKRSLTSQEIFDIAKRYQTKGEFKKHDASALVIAKKRGIYEEAVAHMRGPYEEWTEEKVRAAAATCSTRKEFHKRFSGAQKAAITLGILDEINEQLGYVRTYWTEELVAQEALKHDTRTDFMRNSAGAYNYALKNKLVDKICGHMEVSQIHRTNEELAEIAKKYETRSAFEAGDVAAYSAATKRGILDYICAHAPSKKRRFTDEELIAEAKKYSTIKALRDTDESIYTLIHQRGVASEAFAHTEALRRDFTDEFLLETAKKYSSRRDLCAADSGTYHAIRYRGLQNEAFAHMELLWEKYDDEDLIEIASEFATRTDLIRAYPGAYSSILNRGIEETAFAHMERGITGFNPEKPGVLYYIKFESPTHNTIYKVGITNFDAEFRAKSIRPKNGVIETILSETQYAKGKDAVVAERYILKKYERYLIDGSNHLVSGFSECFDHDILGLDTEAFSEHEVFDASWRASCTVRECRISEVEGFIKAHYLGRRPAVTFLCMVAERQGEAIGCIVYSAPPKELDKRYGGKTWEMSRLYLKDEIPKNAETWLIGKSVRHIKSRYPDVKNLISFVDPSAGHTGTVYKAANWIQDGWTDDDRKSPRVDYADARTGKKYGRKGNVPVGAEIIKVPRVSKMRFHIPLAA